MSCKRLGQRGIFADGRPLCVAYFSRRIAPKLSRCLGCGKHRFAWSIARPHYPWSRMGRLALWKRQVPRGADQFRICLSPATTRRLASSYRSAGSISLENDSSSRCASWLLQLGAGACTFQLGKESLSDTLSQPSPVARLRCNLARCQQTDGPQSHGRALLAV